MVDRLYPGVYVTEVAFQAQPIDGVPTSSASGDAAHVAARDAKLPQAAAPDWTQHNQADPGVTLVQVFTWLADSLLFRAQPDPAQRITLARSGWGVAHGLAVAPSAGDEGSDATVTVSGGLAIAADGRPVSGDGSRPRHHVRKP